MASPGARKLRSRSERERSKKDTRDKFAKLRQLRASGRSATALSDEDDSDDLYEKVDEEEYQQRLQKEGLGDFVIDDDDGGYTENGSDDIGASSSFTSTREQTRLANKPSSAAKPRKLGAMFKSAQMRSLGTKRSQKTEDDEEFMASLMNDLEVPLTPSKSSKPKTPLRNAQNSYSAKRRLAASRKEGGFKPVTPKAEPVHVEDISDPLNNPFDNMPPFKKAKSSSEDPFAMDSVVDKKPTVAELSKAVEESAKNDSIDITDDALLSGLDELANDCAPSLLEEKAPQGQSWMDVQLEMTKHPVLPRQESSASEMDLGGTSGTVHLYWIDVMEKNGALYLIGKESCPQGFRSCCVKITGIKRNLFVLPRLDQATKERFPAAQAYTEFEAMAMRQGIRSFECKLVERKYAFEINGVPACTEYLKVVYGFDQPALPDSMSGETFERVFGTTYSALELFLLKRRIMGPCWLQIDGAQAVDRFNRVSWCRSEFTVADPKDVHTMADDVVAQTGLPKTPPLTSVTMSLKTVMNHRDNINEVVAVSLLVHREMSLDDSTPAAQRAAEQLTLVRQLTGMPLPADFSRIAQAQSRRGLVIESLQSESALLTSLVAHLQRIDPDVLAAHNFYGFDLDVLLHRMRALRTDGWSRLGRLQRTQWPKLQAGAGGMGESSYSERQIMCGRVVCDTYLASKDLIRAKSYSLTSLASQELQIRREEIPFERIPEYFASAKSLLLFLRHTAFDAFLAAALMIQLQALPLTKQLTALAGNLWSRTLMGARAERNEFLLLHEFYRNKYIRPDKFFGSASGKTGKESQKNAASLGTEMSQAIGDADAQDEEEAGAAAGSVNAAGKGGRRKPAYMGGLVLEPKRGLYDRFVLLLDFNSLYPSIIQEFNICFTTVRRPGNPDDIPDMPAPDLPTGILPRLLKTLVDRRRQVKQLLKKAASEEEAAQLNVRQLALKLTANSMYGCLGFTHSRFYAKPLAMLITSRGREILQSTRDLALSEGLEVIYGDTDSIMIATRADSLKEVYDMGAQFKRRVNERYRLLELDIDGVYKRLLLLKKKKYAALQVVNPERGGGETKMETKGLDLVRRDWCELSHDVSDFVLKQLFADPASNAEGGLADHDESAVIANIHEHLTRVGTAVRSGQIPRDKFIIHKGLTKPPENYTDVKSQPHVQVALRLRAKGIAVRSGESIPYIICNVEEGESGSYAERARHPDELQESQGKLVPDFEWYLNQQVLPPCARLLEPLSGTDMSTLAQCLGLDSSKYRSISQPTLDSSSLRTLDSQISDAERFQMARPFMINCPKCHKEYQIQGVARVSPSGQLESGLVCLHCQHLPSSAFVATQLMLQIRQYIREYYAFSTQCDEPSCALTTRILTVVGSKCLRPQCSGRLVPLFSDKVLYYQLQYFAALLNTERSATRLQKPAAEVRLLRDTHAEHLSRLANVVDSYLAVSARKFVDLSLLFSFCCV
ncbi:DNA-directed DNA polymerase alpha catalytic subunit pol1 [Coemansia brasiliensis]|uniref:DNA polymerase n=1 Tax=Coemansia brasiliensis TaxID=2650707 RepID=A0A9W8I8Z2_9FUNG|nr:DNA-directed DNA polymerase alpha catalytic subunit pol1 [Coemansia brasiliensis]